MSKTRRAKGGGRWTARPRTVKKAVKKSNAQTQAPAPPADGTERVFALDISSVCCGWSIFDNGHLLTYGKYKQVGEGHGERMWNFHNWLLTMFNGWAPTEVVYEAPYAGPRRHAFSVLIRYAGVVQLTYFNWTGNELAEDNAVPANLVKKLIGAKKGKNHEANKKIVLMLMNQLYGLNLKFKSKDPKKSVSQDDEADAIAVNLAWHVRYRGLNAGTEVTDEQD
jgi:Holliday junction resolvasome RuvABC endonuclease subunit